MSATITERVTAGAVFLDEHDPDWWRADVERAIDLNGLIMSDGEQCILGQRCPFGADMPYEAYAVELSGFDFEQGDELNEWAVDLGFQAGPPDGEYATLAAEWKRVITERRAGA